MSFEEDFPELKHRVIKSQLYDSNHDVLHGSNKFIQKTDVINFCLSKQKFKEAIDRIVKSRPNAGPEWFDFANELKFELMEK